ncbi:MAG TPA: PAS domain-containing sensor histidine kinase [Usitatibacter sp.]|jgi:PAS domain S-box-containing protein|nr:PAS domain-containing sensor histidine kinase [Usitatibacter sp.]
MSAHRPPRRASGLAEGRLAAIVNSSDDAIISKDLAGRIVSWNPAAERLYGYKAAEILGKSIFTLIPEHLKREEEEILQRVKRGERVEHYETCRLRADGSCVEVSITVSPVYDAEGRIIGSSKIARDISATREAQRRKDEFLAILAHELRNPLAPIRTALHLVHSRQLPAEKLDRAVGLAERQMLHLTRLLDDLLDVARITTGRVDLRIERADLAVLAREAAESVRPVMEKRRHRFTCAIPEEPLWLEADCARIAQILDNLLTNAAKYTPDGGLVSLRVERDEAYGVIRVDDNGIGFREDAGDKLFGLFSREDATIHRSDEGLGIGLALVREFVERHGGSVAAHSAGPMKGSAFIVRLPLCA